MGLIFGLLLFASTPVYATDCAVSGDPIHWIADYCMARLNTDDEIVAGECIHQELLRERSNACESSTHYKTLICEMMIPKNSSYTLDDCLADPEFRGPTVRNHGVGG